MGTDGLQLLTRLRRELKDVAEPEKAPQMQAYMKSEMPYHGAQSARTKAVSKHVFRDVAFHSHDEFSDAVLEIWDGAEFREERYCAIALTRHKSGKGFQTPVLLPMYEHMVVTGAWWDYVDELASHPVGNLLRHHPNVMKKKMLTWSRSKNIWKRRTAILSQLGFKQDIDLDHLYACIEPSLDESEFFLRKGIGWALRSVAWHDPKEIIRYVRAHKYELSPLSKKEALKNVLKQGLIDKVP